MNEISISLPVSLKDFIDTEVASGLFRSPSDYLEALVREAEKRKAHENVEQLLVEGLQSGEAKSVNKTRLGRHPAPSARTPVPARRHMSRTIRSRPSARWDLVELAEHIQENSLVSADRFIDAVEETLQLVASMPEMGSPWESQNPKLAGLRFVRVKGVAMIELTERHAR
jgi:antitoxin ParD1/3/4